MIHYAHIEPPELLHAFSNAGVLVSMSEGPPGAMDSHGELYKTILVEPAYRIIGLPEDRFVANLKLVFFRQLLQFMGGARDVVIEWHIWPEIAVDDLHGRVYARLTARPRIVN